MILLATLNSSYQHTAFGLRYLYANMKELKEQCQLQEFTINQDLRLIAEKILSFQPEILGLGIYIWNARQSLDLVRVLKQIKPELTIILGGPEISYETESQELFSWCDFVIRGEGDQALHRLCLQILRGEKPTSKIIKAELPEIADLASPYREYTDDDIKNRVLYVEASRGCPYKCEYCLSSLDTKVRNFPIDNFLNDMQILLDRGARQFKFVDRTFNLSPQVSTKILRFFLERMDLEPFLHFEMVPDRLPLELRDLISQFPEGSLQFEIGIQTWNPVVAQLVSRRQDYQKIKDNFHFLKSSTHVHTHADLIVGLPGESMNSFAEGFDILSECAPDEIQVGLLKRLKGTPIIRHNEAFQMTYQCHPPFQILKNKDMSYQEIQKMVSFSKYWDLIANSGNFPNFMIWLKSQETSNSFFFKFMELVEFLVERHAESHGIALLKLVESVWCFLIQKKSLDPVTARSILTADYSEGPVKRDLPNFLKKGGAFKTSPSKDAKAQDTSETRSGAPQRQLRHLRDRLSLTDQ